MRVVAKSQLIKNLHDLAEHMGSQGYFDDQANIALAIREIERLMRLQSQIRAQIDLLEKSDALFDSELDSEEALVAQAERNALYFALGESPPLFTQGFMFNYYRHQAKEDVCA